MKQSISKKTVINAENLSLIFETNDGAVHALKDIDLNVEKKDFVSFIGPSGCGKTTFLRVVADLEKPSGGQITINGKTPQIARQDRDYGYVFQAPALLQWRSISQNISLPLEIMGYSKEEQKTKLHILSSLGDLEGIFCLYNI